MIFKTFKKRKLNYDVNATEVIEFYKTHSLYTTLKEFTISRGQLEKICLENNFVKSKEQIAETKRLTYKNTSEERKDKLDFSSYNRKRTNLRKYGVDNVMKNPDIVKKSIRSKKENNMKNNGKEVE